VSHYSNTFSELQELRGLSARLGHNPLLVQASTGNVSVKLGDSLWIKASGKRLIDAEADDFLVCVNLRMARRCFMDGVNIAGTAIASGSGEPSIETAMHAVLPERVVIHVHSVSTIAWAVRQDAQEQLRTRLRGMNWAWIPYTQSGIPLARRIRAAVLSVPRTDVFVLGNHGLVVCGPDCGSAEELLAEVEARLAIAPRPAPQPNMPLLEHAAASGSKVLPARLRAHALATDETSCRIVCRGVLYPCQAMFLPEMVAHPRGQSCPADFISLIPDVGLLCPNILTAAQEEILAGLVEVAQRLPATAPIRYLTQAEVSDLLAGPVYPNVPARREKHSTAVSAISRPPDTSLQNGV